VDAIAAQVLGEQLPRCGNAIRRWSRCSKPTGTVIGLTHDGLLEHDGVLEFGTSFRLSGIASVYTAYMETRVECHQPVSVEEYLRLEESSPFKHEYIEGRLYAMVGVTTQHDDIASNILGTFFNAARGKSCRVNTGELSLRVSERRFYYPDVTVYGEPIRAGARYRSEPAVVVEVLSPSTVGTDRREKLFAYLAIERLETYLVVSQDERRVEHHWRDEDGVWRELVLTGFGSIPIRCLGFELTLDEIYAGVTFEEPRGEGLLDGR
jgi:Uma2 family endonuclease